MREIAHVMPTYRYALPAWNLLAGKGVGTNDVLILAAYTALFLGLAAVIQRRVDSRPDGG